MPRLPCQLMHRALTRKGAMTLLVAVQKGVMPGTSEAVTRGPLVVIGVSIRVTRANLFGLFSHPY